MRHKVCKRFMFNHVGREIHILDVRLIEYSKEYSVYAQNLLNELQSYLIEIDPLGVQILSERYGVTRTTQ